jgi:hypothetical protein
MRVSSGPHILLYADTLGSPSSILWDTLGPQVLYYGGTLCPHLLLRGDAKVPEIRHYLFRETTFHPSVCSIYPRWSL